MRSFRSALAAGCALIECDGHLSSAGRLVVIREGYRPIDPAGMLKESGADVYWPHWGAMDPQVVKEIHAAGGAVAVWPVDDAPGIAWCKYCKPDSIFTNRPAEVGPALRA